MRILMLNYEYPPLGGGAGNATRHLLAAYADTGDLDVDLVTSSIERARVEHVSERIRIHFLDIGKDDRLHYQSNRDLVAYAWHARRHVGSLAAMHRYACCHAFFGIPCGYIAMRAAIPYVVSLRGSDVPGYNPRFALADAMLFRRLSRRIWAKAAAVVANSDGLRDLARHTAPDQPIDVIGNGVDTYRFTPAATLTEPCRLLCVARLVARKGIDDVMRALTRLPEATLTIVGTGPEEAALRALAHALGVSQRVHWAGAVDPGSMPERYRAAGVFVSASRNEGMSNAALEAMASGLPLLLTDTGGTRELLTDARNGFVIPMHAPEAIVERVRWYMAHRDEHLNHGRASRERAEPMSWAAAAHAYRALYGRAAGDA